MTHQLATSFKSLDFSLIIDGVQWLLNMAGCCKSSCGTIVHTGAVTWYNFPSDISLQYSFGKNLMMWTQKSNNKIASKLVGVLFPSTVWWESYYENGKRIRSDFNWSINLVNILMFTWSLIKSVFVIFFISYFPPLFRFGFCNISKEYREKT